MPLPLWSSRCPWNLGVALGMALGVALGMAFGVALGMALGALAALEHRTFER